jgi:predicted transcriptional regulator
MTVTATANVEHAERLDKLAELLVESHEAVIRRAVALLYVVEGERRDGRVIKFVHDSAASSRPKDELARTKITGGQE